MDELTRVSKAELDSINKCYYASLFAKNNGDKFRSIYYEDYENVGWICLTPVAFKASHNPGVEDPNEPHIGTYNYHITVSHKFLVCSTMQLNVPNLQLKKEYIGTYRFKLVDDVGFKISPSAKVEATEEQILSLDHHSQIVLYEKMTKPGHKEALEKMMGTHTLCAEWTTHIKAKSLFYRQQWSYSFAPSKAFPIYLLNKPDDLCHQYQFCLDISRHLNLQMFNDQTLEWDLVQVDMSLFINPPKKFSQPLLFGVFGDISPAELDERRKNNICKFYIMDMVSDVDEDETGMPGKNIKKTIPKFPGIVQSRFWMLENVSNVDSNITCNYTGDVMSGKGSETAIVSNTMKTKAGYKFKNLPSPLFEGALSPYNFNHSSSRPGILTWSYVDRVGDRNNGGSKPQDIDTITCAISKDVAPLSEFKLIVRDLVVKEMTIIDGKVKISSS